MGIFFNICDNFEKNAETRASFEFKFKFIQTNSTYYNITQQAQ